VAGLIACPIVLCLVVASIRSRLLALSLSRSLILLAGNIFSLDRSLILLAGNVFRFLLLF
jgi:hypothetical protein